ncbi:hypothetical protein AGIG_G16232 [Arapaima gigas]
MATPTTMQPAVGPKHLEEESEGLAKGQFECLLFFNDAATSQCSSGHLHAICQSSRLAPERCFTGVSPSIPACPSPQQNSGPRVEPACTTIPQAPVVSVFTEV